MEQGIVVCNGNYVQLPTEPSGQGRRDAWFLLHRRSSWIPWETKDGCLRVYPLPGIRSTYSFRLTVLYTKKAPQLSTQELVVFSKKMAAAASRCCPLRDELQSACMEDQVSTLVTHLPSLSVGNQPHFLDVYMTYQWN